MKRGIQRLEYLQAQPATPRARWHPRSRAEDVLCKKGFLSAGNLTDTAIGLAVDEKQLISWARTSQPKKSKKDRYVSFEVEAGSRTLEEANMMHDLLQPTEIALHRSSTAAHISSHTWIAAQKPGSHSRSPSLQLV